MKKMESTVKKIMVTSIMCEEVQIFFYMYLIKNIYFSNGIITLISAQ